MLHNFFAREEGQGLVEYAMILMLIALVVIGSLSALGVQVTGMYNSVVGSWPP